MAQETVRLAEYAADLRPLDIAAVLPSRPEMHNAAPLRESRRCVGHATFAVTNDAALVRDFGKAR